MKKDIPGGFFLTSPTSMMVRENDRRAWVECCICGRRMRSLGKHLLAAHGINARAYRRTYDLPTMCEDLRETHSAQREDQHGAPYWTEDRIASALRRASKNGVAPKSTTYNRGTRRRDQPSYPVIKYVFGSWEAAVAYAGLKLFSSVERTHCRAGHLLSEDSYVDSGVRRCRVCRRAKDKARYRRRTTP